MEHQKCISTSRTYVTVDEKRKNPRLTSLLGVDFIRTLGEEVGRMASQESF